MTLISKNFSSGLAEVSTDHPVFPTFTNERYTERGSKPSVKGSHPLDPMTDADAPTPEEVLADLADSDDDECLYLDTTEPAYIWAAQEDDRYILLEQSRSGSWLPAGRPIDTDEVTHRIEQTLDSDDTCEIRPQTSLPPGRHRRD